MATTFLYSDSLTIAEISLCTTIVCEVISWLLVYHRRSYKSLKSTIDKASKKLESMKTSPNALKNSKAKKINRVEASLNESNIALSFFKFKSDVVIALVLIVVFQVMNSLYGGKVVGKLPFVPVSFVWKMSHRGLRGDNPTDCSMAFLYLLCSISIRTNLQKLLGFRGASVTDLFPVPDQSGKNN